MTHDDYISMSRSSARALLGEQISAGARHSSIDLGQGLSPLWSEGGIFTPLPPDISRNVAQWLALIFAVIDLDPTVIDREWTVKMEQRRRISGAAERTGPCRQHRRVQQLSDGRCLLLAVLRKRGVGSTEQESLGIGLGLAVTDKDQHLRREPECARTDRRW